MNKNRKVEVLAPCGSFEALEAAIFSGADAVYLGGDKFGARAYASNFNQEELIRALNFVHLHGKKLYLTVNTLLKESETKEIYEYLRKPYEYGLDAVIVQDLGVASYVRKHFPEMDLHISTQATVTGVSSALLAKSLGASRIVPARELSFEEIRAIKDATGLEIEVFVHGALCYCYSGQCLLSSMIGGRSGNRGRCAQPCRLPYQAFDEKGIISNEKESYLLSPKDLYGLENLDQLILAGTDSLKIEGRMKKPEYVALVTSKYRKYVDQFEKTGKIQVSAEDKQELMDIYNRGGFTDGYYETYHGKNMMSMEVPNHIGVFVGTIEKMNKNQIGFRPQVKIEKQDVFTIKAKNKEVTLTSPISGETGKLLWLNAMNLKELKVGDKIYRTRNNELVEKINILKNQVQKKQCKAKVSLIVGKPAVFEVEFHSIKVSLTDFVVERANQLPTQKEEILNLIQKTGNLNFDFSEIELELSKDAFIPKKFVKQLRNQAVLRLEEKIYETHKRKLTEQDSSSKTTEILKDQALDFVSSEQILSVKVRTKEQLETVLSMKEVRKIYLSYELVLRNKDWLSGLNFNEGNKAWYLALPEIIRKKDEPLLEELLSYTDKFEGVLVENWEEIGYLLNKNYRKKIVYGAFCYQYNRMALEYHKKLFKDSLSTFPYELNKQEAKDLPGEEYEMVVYGLLPLMKSVQCVKNNTKGCRKVPENLYLKDRKNEKMLVLPMCEFCYNLIFNSKPIMLLDQGDYFTQKKVTKYRLEFTNESSKQVKEIVNCAVQGLLYGNKIEFKGEYTRGHFNRGVE
ncbi:MAG: U32 family peptidase [Lachnospiraceae bacterium]|nr:U32 family peptidase [Lachnospiraceae bacterium]